jgi:hypothetical protein
MQWENIMGVGVASSPKWRAKKSVNALAIGTWDQRYKTFLFVI